MNVFTGISASGGIGLGTAFIIPETEKRIVPQRSVKPEDIGIGWERFKAAVEAVSARLKAQITETAANKIQKEIFESYLAMLSDAVFIKEIKTSYEKELYNIEYVLDKKTGEYEQRLRDSKNEYLTERAKDIRDVFDQVLNELLDYHPFNTDSVPDGAVIVARVMNPTDAIVLSKRKIAGLALTEGGKSSHVTILARNYGIPSVFAVTGITSGIPSGTTVIVDGEKGKIIADPDEKTLSLYRQRIKDEEERKKVLNVFRTKEALTKDGVKFHVFANIGTPDEARTALKEGADGIGLFRTEFLFMAENQSFSEEAQFEAYKEVLETMGGKPVTIRTLDAGGDKLIKGLGDMTSSITSAPTFSPASAPDAKISGGSSQSGQSDRFNQPVQSDFKEKNPLMGLRAIRFSLAHPEILKTQLRALYRAGVYGNLKIMLPLISSAEQIEKAKIIADTAQKELAAEGVPFKKNVPLGIMVETAAAALISDSLAKTADFFSIGTNDLTQYTIGIDRENPFVAELYDECHPAVLRMIQNTLQNAAASGISVSVCGEMASRQNGVLVLGGMGIRNLSMTAKQISAVKEILSKFTIKEMQDISSKALNNLI
ncbi:phosphoenolpyruvate--protein phosphotransferase [Treponema parvum]|uniref:Phosphoenolpyruvate-protein phosphotransferase n=1 Tax=Treponema parvum TaxID=138851 RepID=A0A975EXP7_9SPIR|nr:putative PEP-binding protein [Treponema parvum]QTQ10732.1 phosphoenolpyruvate--protein phosphotransferase [Treponema parvum]